MILNNDGRIGISATQSCEAGFQSLKRSNMKVAYITSDKEFG